MSDQWDNGDEIDAALEDKRGRQVDEALEKHELEADIRNQLKLFALNHQVLLNEGALDTQLIGNLNRTEAAIKRLLLKARLNEVRIVAERITSTPISVDPRMTAVNVSTAVSERAAELTKAIEAEHE